MIKYVEKNNNGERICGYRVFEGPEDKEGKPISYKDPSKAVERYKKDPRFKHH